MNKSKELEQEAKKEYLLIIDTLKSDALFKDEWKGHWDDKVVRAFNGKEVKIKGDKLKFITYYLKNINILNQDYTIHGFED